MRKYRFRKNSNEPSDEFIRGKMDFNGLLKNQQNLHRYSKATQPLYKNRFFMGFMILLGVICLVLIFEEPENESNLKKNTKDSVQLDSLKSTKPSND